MINIEQTTENGNSELAKTQDGSIFEYCKAAPDSTEWQAYQEQRLFSINVLKMKNLKSKDLTDVADVTTKTNNNEKTKCPHLDPVMGESKTNLPLQLLPTDTPCVPAILKKANNRSQPKDTSSSNVTWKEPVADTKFLPVGYMKVPIVPKLEQTKTAFSAKNPKKTTAKCSKSYKRNNGKSNLGTSESLATIKAEYEDNRAIEEDNKAGKPKNHTDGSEINSQSSSGTPTTTTALKFQVEATLRPNDALPTTMKKGKGFSMQTMKHEPARKIKTMEMAEEHEPTASVFGIKHSPQAFPDNNNNNVFWESTSTISSNEINHVKASSLQSASNPTTKWKWQREAKVDGVCDSITYSFHRQDINGNNTDLCASTQKPTKKCSVESSKLDVEAVKDNFGDTSSSLFEDSDVKLSDMNGNNIENKLIEEFGKERVSKTLLTRVVCERANLLGKRNVNAQGVNVNMNKESNFRDIPFQKKNKLLKFDEVETLLNRFTPPELPQIEVCNVLPGTPQWQVYWKDFNQKIAGYYTSVEKFSKQMDDLLVDDDGCEYQKELKKRCNEERAIQLRMGITIPKPPLIRQPLTDTLEIGGYVIRPLGGSVEQAMVSTTDHSSFRLEIPSEKINDDLGGITVDTKLNLMTVAIPSGMKGSSFLKLVQISVPPYKRVQNLEVGGPLNNGGKIVVIGK